MIENKTGGVTQLYNLLMTVSKPLFTAEALLGPYSYGNQYTVATSLISRGHGKVANLYLTGGVLE